MPPPSRREFIKWVLYLGAVSTLPAISCVADVPKDVLEGLSCVHKKIADLSGNAPTYRASEDAAFEICMREVWEAHNGSDRYVRVFQDLGIQPPRKWLDEDGVLQEQPESYVSLFQYRRA